MQWTICLLSCIFKNEKKNTSLEINVSKCTEIKKSSLKEMRGFSVTLNMSHMIPVTTSHITPLYNFLKLCRMYKGLGVSFMKNENKYQHLNYIKLSPQFPVCTTEFLWKSFKYPVVNIITVTFFIRQAVSISDAGNMEHIQPSLTFHLQSIFLKYISLIQFYHPTLISDTVHYTANLKKIPCE